mmetsp:Transcript_21836/g.51573  ORF Transcript_21836/g.51573 Transcript_21836/m.51573 type:complete len:279 (-) Transcript_21836:1156-1992(-)
MTSDTLHRRIDELLIEKVGAGLLEGADFVLLHEPFHLAQFHVEFRLQVDNVESIADRILWEVAARAHLTFVQRLRSVIVFPNKHRPATEDQLGIVALHILVAKADAALLVRGQIKVGPADRLQIVAPIGTRCQIREIEGIIIRRVVDAKSVVMGHERRIRRSDGPAIFAAPMPAETGLGQYFCGCCGGRRNRGRRSIRCGSIIVSTGISSPIAAAASVLSCHCPHRRTNGNRHDQHGGTEYDELGLVRHPSLLLIFPHTIALLCTKRLASRPTRRGPG